MAGVLEGVRVVDFGQYIAGPLTAMMLRDHGAEVIRVERPGGPCWNTPANAIWNRGKRSIVLDLTRDSDRAHAQRIVARADVVIENFRPGVMDRLGLGAEVVCAANPALVYCSLPGFASDDPRSPIQAWEGVVAAATDTYKPARTAKSSRPSYSPVPIASNFAAFLAATSIVAALIARERCGRGQRIEVPLFDAMFEAIGGSGLVVHARGGAPNRGPRMTSFGQGVYECADGRWVQFNTFNPRFLHWFARAANVEHWADDGLLDRERVGADPALDAELTRRMTALMKTRSALDWEEFINREAGSPLCFIRTSQEWLEHPHARESRAVVPVVDPELGPTWQAGFPVSLSESSPASPEGRHAIDADRAAILAELEAPLPPVRPSSAPLRAALEGVKVLDLTQVFAGPMAGRVLAEFGADVIKINGPTLNVADNLHLNRGKRTMLLDVSIDDGREVLWRLLDDADVFMQNFTYGTADRMGIGYRDVIQRRPSVVYSSVSAHNYDGPWAARRGYEPMGQAATGMQARFGGSGQPAGQAFALNDYGTGVLGAFSIVLGLFHSVRTGQGQHVQGSLSQTGTFHQTPFMISYDGKVWDEPSGVDLLGAGMLQRIYEARDGWFFLGAREAAASRVADALGIPAQALSEEALEATFAAGDRDEWCTRLTRAGVGAHPLVDRAELMKDPWVVEHRLSITREHEQAGLVTHTGPSARLSLTPVTAGAPARPPGSDGAEILRELGMEDSVDALIERP